jgi:hypothetical protein
MHRKVKGIMLLLASAGLLYVAYTLDDGQPAAASRLPGSDSHNGTGGAPELPAGHPALTAGGSCPLGYDNAGGGGAAATASPPTAAGGGGGLSCEQLQGRGRSADAASCFAQEKAQQLALPGLPGGGVRPGFAAAALGEARSLRAAGRRAEALRVAEEAAGAWRSVDLAAAAAEEGEAAAGVGAIGVAVIEARALRLAASLHVSLLGPEAAAQYEVMAGLVRPSAAAAAAALSAAAAAMVRVAQQGGGQWAGWGPEPGVRAGEAAEFATECCLERLLAVTAAAEGGGAAAVEDKEVEDVQLAEAAGLVRASLWADGTLEATKEERQPLAAAAGAAAAAAAAQQQYLAQKRALRQRSPAFLLLAAVDARRAGAWGAVAVLGGGGAPSSSSLGAAGAAAKTATRWLERVADAWAAPEVAAAAQAQGRSALLAQAAGARTKAAALAQQLIDGAGARAVVAEHGLEARLQAVVAGAEEVAQQQPPPQMDELRRLGEAQLP